MKTRLSTKGQLIIPKEIRDRFGWEPGQELLLEEGDGFLLLRPQVDLPEAGLDDLVGCTGYHGPRRSLDDMEAAIAQGARERA
jgi:AbrB family looped-hinge helix DNA binding protein